MLDRLRTAENEQGVRTWLASPKVRPVAIDNGILTLECPTALFQYTIRDRYAKPLATIASTILGVAITEVQCRVSGTALREHETRLGQPIAVAATATPTRQGGRSFGHGFKLLENFVVGHCNRLAFDSVKRILDDPRHPVNPLFIHGASGLGKTHLEQGLALAFKERYPMAKV